MTKAELDLGRKKAREILRRIVGWQADMINDDQINQVIQGVVEEIDDYRKARKG